METTDMAVLVGGRRLAEARDVWDATDVGVHEWPEDLEEGGLRLERLYDQGVHRFAVFGGDELAGRIVTAYRRRGDLGAHPLELWPLEIGTSLVAAHAGDPIAPGRAGRLVARGVEQWDRERIGTLKVTASTESAAWYGFSFGVGWVYRALEARKRARGGIGNLVSALGQLATETFGGDEDGQPVAARTSIDYRPVEDSVGSMIVSTLEDTPFGPGSSGDGAVVWEGLSASELMRRSVGPSFVGGVDGRPFECIHLDSPDGWLLDGRLHGGADAGVVQVVPGPTVTVVRPRTGLAALVGGVF